MQYWYGGGFQGQTRVIARDFAELVVGGRLPTMIYPWIPGEMVFILTFRRIPSHAPR
jgi:hypothetical protein